ncbi:hypothetical protein SANTM175S_03530 [Streptomyces antimycoticus]
MSHPEVGEGEQGLSAGGQAPPRGADRAAVAPQLLREFVLQLARRPEIADIRSSIIYLSRRAKAIEPVDGP